MTFQANVAATHRTARPGLRSFGSRARSADRFAAVADPTGKRPLLARCLLGSALVASAATPLMAAAGVADGLVAAPLFLAGLAVAGASWVQCGATVDDRTDLVVPKDDENGRSALPLADLFETPAFVVTPAGCIVDANGEATSLRSRLGQRAEPPVLFDLMAPTSRAAAMAALRSRPAAPVQVRLNDGDEKRLHVLSGAGAGNLIVVLGMPVAETADGRSGMLSDAMLATVSHELRTPLNAIIGFSGILENELYGKLGTDRQREYVGLIQSSGRHLLAVVNGILDVSKIEAGAYELHCEQFLLDEITEEAVAMVRCQAEEKGIRVVLDAPSGGTAIHGDRRALYQSLVNLLANAVKFTEAGEVRIGWERCGRDLRLTVSDTGIGIPADQIGRLGRPFVQASCGVARRYEGTGLGLAYVRGMCELHGGAMTITSTEGQGTHVVLDMPLVPRQAAHLEDQNIVALNHVRDPKHAAFRALSERRTA